MVKPPAAHLPDDDELDELPPLDGESDDPDDGAEELDALPEDDASALDDSVDESDADADELDLNLGEGSWIDEETHAGELDIGEPELSLFEGGQDDSDEQEDMPPSDDEVAFTEGPVRGLFDGGDEGPVDQDEPLRDEDLPGLDADDEGESPDSAFVDEQFAPDDPVGLPWASQPWVRVGSPLEAMTATAVVCAGRGALVAAVGEADPARRLAHVDLEGACQWVAAAGLDRGEIQALAAVAAPMPAGLVVALQGGRVRVSLDGGAQFERRAEALDVAEIALGSRGLWLRTRGGGLLSLATGARERDVERLPVLGTVAAVASERTGELAALVLEENGRPLALLRGPATEDGPRDSEKLVRVPLEGPVARSNGTLLAVRSGWVAYLSPTGVVHGPLGGPLRNLTFAGQVTALVFVDDGGTLVAATYLDGDDSTGLIRTGPNANAEVVARVGARRDKPLSDGRTSSLAWDAARGVLWMVGGFGVAAFAIAPR